MAFSLNEIFTTRTALPENCGVIEIEPIAALKPYVRCFWTYSGGERIEPIRIIPDCCADIMIDIGGGGAAFCGMIFDSFFARNVGTVFGIRFYAWAVSRFVRETAAACLSADPIELFGGFSDFKDRMIEAQTTERRVALAQRYLLGIFDGRCDSDVMNGLYHIIRKNGNISINELADSVAVSGRTLERRFIRSVGVTPKVAAKAIRYQLLWQDCIKWDFSALDCVEKFGYYDQAHMYNDFKAFHGINPSEARKEYLSLVQAKS